MKKTTLEELNDWADLLKEYDQIIEDSINLEAKFQTDLDNNEHWISEKYLKESIAKLKTSRATSITSRERIINTYFLT